MLWRSSQVLQSARAPTQVTSDPPPSNTHTHTECNTHNHYCHQPKVVPVCLVCTTTARALLLALHLPCPSLCMHNTYRYIYTHIYTHLPYTYPSQVLLEVARALQHLHGLGLIHCDIKPENVLVVNNAAAATGFVCKLADFGMVKMCGTGKYITNKCASSRLYAHGYISLTKMHQKAVADDIMQREQGTPSSPDNLCLFISDCFCQAASILMQLLLFDRSGMGWNGGVVGCKLVSRRTSAHP
jgi:serine/threonine protein kinase